MLYVPLPQVAEGITALFSRVVPLYGLMAYSVEQRTQEIGIRLALGAGSQAVRNMVVWQGMRLALAGVAIGIAAAFALTRMLRVGSGNFTWPISAATLAQPKLLILR